MAGALTIQLPNIPSAIALGGDGEENLKILSRQTGAILVLRGQELLISGTVHLLDTVLHSFHISGFRVNLLM
jgi:phosphate starvation-inducible PhoH-like protein